MTGSEARGKEHALKVLLLTRRGRDRRYSDRLRLMSSVIHLQLRRYRRQWSSVSWTYEGNTKQAGNLYGCVLRRSVPRRANQKTDCGSGLPKEKVVGWCLGEKPVAWRIEEKVGVQEGGNNKNESKVIFVSD